MSKAICYFANGLGNFILLMPAIQALASMTDEKKVDICLPDEWSDYRKVLVEQICESWPTVDKVIHFPREQLNEGEYDLWFWTAHGASSQGMKVFLRNARHRAVPKPHWRSSRIHERDHYMEIARAMGYVGDIPRVDFPLAEKPLLNGIRRPVVGFCNGAFKTKEWQKKHWPFFGKLAEVMKQFFGGSIIGLGGPDELVGVSLDQDFTRGLKVTETAKVMTQCDLIVTTDTGPMHLADLLDIPMVAIFGPTLTSKNAPKSSRASTILSGANCAPCQDAPQFYHCSRYLCMEKINVSDVMAVARGKL